jgi:hypothetical protein
VNCDSSAWEETSVTVAVGRSGVKCHDSALEDTQWPQYTVRSSRLKCHCSAWEETRITVDSGQE